MSRGAEELNRRLLRARDAMDRAYAGPLNVRAVAAVAHTSPAHFSRCFRTVFGESVHHIRREGRVLTCATIAEHVWDAELDIDSNIVEVYIGYLRRKLNRPFDRSDIETVGGIGYRLRDVPVPVPVPDERAAVA